MSDLFASPDRNGKHYDLFGGEIDTFRWIVAVFSSDGASQIIKRANEHELKTFYPLRTNIRGEYVPLWANYLFIEFRESVTIDLCRSTTKFVRVISTHDEEGILRPVLVRKNAIAESLRLVTMGKFNEVEFKRRFYGKGSIVRVMEGSFSDRNVRLEIDIPPYMNARTKVPVDINGIKAKIELFKLAL